MPTNNPKPRILIFSTAYYPFVGGAEVAIKEITDRLRGDFDFDLITTKLQKDLPSFEKVGSVNVYRIGSGRRTLDKILLPWRGAILSSRINRKYHYFCMWGMMATFASGAGYIFNIARKISGNKKIPIILTLQEGDSENHLQYRWAGLIALSWKLALRQTTILTAISNFLLNRASRNGFEGESFLVPNGVDVKAFTKEVPDRIKDELKIKLNKQEGDVFLVTSGRLTHKNGVDDVISSLAYLPKNIHFIIIGKGEQGSRLQKQANDLGVASRVKFVGFLPYEEIPKYLSICDIFIRASRSEGFGNSFIEAMAAKLPVIATPVGGIPDFIDDKETGIFCSPDNPQSIVRAVNTILGDNALRAKMVEKAHHRVVDRYSWDHIASEMSGVFKKLSK